MTDPAVLARLDAIEALLIQLLEKQQVEVVHPHSTVEEEINLVLQQGIDPVVYLKEKYAKHREAQKR